MSRYTKGVVHLFLILILTLIAFVGIGYWTYKNGQIKLPSTIQTNLSPTPTPDPTANWKIYTSKVFSFKYPPEWSVKETKNEWGNEIRIDNNSQKVTIRITDEQVEYGFGGPGNSITKKVPIEFVFIGETYSSTENIVNNRTAFVDQRVELNQKVYFILFGVNYPVNDSQYASLNDYQKEKATILQILSTFKFTEKQNCIDSNQQCLEKPDGTECTYGVWCDKDGNICGGQSCVGLGIGVCRNNVCLTK